MTIKEFMKLSDGVKKVAAEMYKATGNNFTLKDIDIIVNRARQEEDLRCLRKLNKIRKEVCQLNKECGFHDIPDIEYKEFLEAMRHFTFEERMKISFTFLQHIAALNNIVFDEEDEECQG